jgi:hypothetical protein
MKTPSLLPASIGSITTGTFRTEDLLSAYLHELEWQAHRNGAFLSLPENFWLRDAIAKAVGEAQDCFADDGETIREEMEGTAEDLVGETLVDLLLVFAPPYCYFGPHCGDGADIGFWPDFAAIEDLPCIADNSDETIAAEQSPEFSTDVRFVNDHGNTTVYGADGSVLLELV